ncbi:hypothetical protein NQD34_013600, partial [Periophthalmus magnuspinnatus]
IIFCANTHLLQVQQDDDDDQVTMAVIITPSDIKIILEGEAVMTNLQSAIKGFVMLFGLIYTLNMRYLKKCERTYEFVQKVLLGLESKRMSTKVHQLSVLLHSK